MGGPSLVEVMTDGHDVPWPPFGPLHRAGLLRFGAVSAPNVYPQAVHQAAPKAARARCATAGKRLCAPVEWRKACMGPKQTTFGYGAERVTGRCNDFRRVQPDDAPVPRRWHDVVDARRHDRDERRRASTSWTRPLSPTGSHDQCTNDYGVYDMVGNLHEWTNDPNGTFQGGYYLDTHKNGDGCSYRTVAHEFHSTTTTRPSFRCLCARPWLRSDSFSRGAQVIERPNSPSRHRRGGRGPAAHARELREARSHVSSPSRGRAKRTRTKMNAPHARWCSRPRCDRRAPPRCTSRCRDRAPCPVDPREPARSARTRTSAAPWGSPHPYRAP